MSKTFGNNPSNPARSNVPDVEFYGTKDLFKCLSKAWSDKEGWMRSTKAMNIPDGIVLQVSHQNGTNIAEAVTSITGITVVGDDKNGYSLKKIPKLIEEEGSDQ